MDKSKLLDQCGALGDDRLLLARVLDRERQASERNVPAATDFLSPAQQAMAMDMLRTAGISETAYVRLGGYDDAERALLLFLPDWLDAADAEGQSPIRCLRAQFRADEKLTHRDFLGSLMGRFFKCGGADVALFSAEIRRCRAPFSKSLLFAGSSPTQESR